MISNEIRSKIVKDKMLSFSQIGLLFFLLEEDGIHTVSSLAIRSKAQGITALGSMVKDLVEMGFLYKGKQHVIHVNNDFIAERYK